MTKPEVLNSSIASRTDHHASVPATCSVCDRRSELEAALDGARAETEEERKRFARVLDQAPFPVSVLLGSELIFATSNDLHGRLLGKLDVRGLALRQAFPEPESKPFIDIVEQVYRTGRLVAVRELPLDWDRIGDGSVSQGFFDIIYQPLRDPLGHVEGVIVLVVDMTESVRARRSVDAARSAAEAARMELEQVHDELESRIKARTAELALTNSALAAEIAERIQAERIRTDLLRRLASAQEDEQRRVARDLHDQIGQTLTALTLAVRTARAAGPLPEAASERLVEVQRIAEELGKEVHELAIRLRPTALDDLGLNAALGQLLSDWSSRTRVEVDFQAEGLESGRLPSEVETAVYRVVQEALTNIARHAKAQHVSIVVERHDGHAITMVEDDGIGFKPELYSARLGLVGMRERVTLVGGRLDIESSEGQGTTVIARIPLPGAAGVVR
jgi:signal transduction histidine kinase